MGLSTVPYEDLKQAVFESHAGSFEAYFRVYDDLKSNAEGNVQYPGLSATSFEPAVLQAIAVIKNDPKVTLSSLRQRIQQSVKGASDSIYEQAINAAVQCLTMVDSLARERHAEGYALGDYRPLSWHPEEAFSHFVGELFTRNLITERVNVALASQSKLKAWKLRRHHGIRLFPTDNLAEHLVYDPRHQRLYLFHHTEFLKAQLAKFPNNHQAPQPELSIEESLQKGSLPPRLLVETLHSLNKVLFNNASDRESENLLHRMMSKFPTVDRDLNEFDKLEFTEHYRYWGKRIADLHKVVLDKPPRSSLERWFQRHCSERNALFVALIALLISTVVGLISIGFAILQSWIAWMAWKYPVQNQ